MASNDDPLAQRLLAGDKRALARGISLVENDDPAGWELVREVYPHTGKAAIMGFTGPPGAGKSTLLGALTKLGREQEQTVAVLSIDPSSPFTKGALLGDRIRLSEHFLDPGVFIRSMASRGALGGLSESTLQAALLMDASGRDVVMLETVGVGQAEVDIIDHADTVVLVLMPGSGDSIQALKAGVMEIPDVIVVNKADHPLTDTMVREIKGVLALGPRLDWEVPIIRTEAIKGEGVAELSAKLDEHRAHIEAQGTLSERRRRNLMSEVLGLATFRMRRELEESIAEDQEVQELLDRVVSRELDPASAAGDHPRTRGQRPASGAVAGGGCPDGSVGGRGARADRGRGRQAPRAGARRSGAARARSAGGGATDSSFRGGRDRARRLGARSANQRRGDRTGVLLRGVRSAGAAAGEPPGRLRMLRRRRLSRVPRAGAAQRACWQWRPRRRPCGPRTGSWIAPPVRPWSS